MPDAPQEISLLDSLDGEWIKLLVPVMQDVGPAAQTLGGLLKVTAKETYSPVDQIASSARVPVATARKQLAILDAHGWIHNAGRQHTRRGSPRRTCTIKVADKTRKALDTGRATGLSYGILPWWACCSITKIGKLPWCAKSVLSIVLARLAGLKKGSIMDGYAETAEDVIGQIENMGGDDRFRFSLTRLEKFTGLTRDSVTTAKRLLNHRLGILELYYDHRRQGGVATPTDLLAPRWDFRVIVTPTDETHCKLAFSKGEAKSGQ
jgi:hypothetical protein